jgi:hypothetical protein
VTFTLASRLYRHGAGTALVDAAKKTKAPRTVQKRTLNVFTFIIRRVQDRRHKPDLTSEVTWKEYIHEYKNQRVVFRPGFQTSVNTLLAAEPEYLDFLKACSAPTKKKPSTR